MHSQKNPILTMCNGEVGNFVMVKIDLCCFCFDPPKINFLDAHISGAKGHCPLKIAQLIEDDQRLLTHGDGSTPNNFSTFSNQTIRVTSHIQTPFKDTLFSVSLSHYLGPCPSMRPDSVPDLGAIQIIYLLTYLLTYLLFSD